MSPIRLPKLQDVTSKIAQLRGRRRSHSKVRSQRPMKHRSLAFDPLEERQLLSLSAVDYQDVLVNETYNASGTLNMVAGQSIAVDNDGDFVVVWARQDTVTWGSNNSKTMQDWNIYARYFTDEVQRVTVPSETLEDTNSSLTGTITLRYGGTSAIQKISFTAAYEPNTPKYSQELINRAFTLSFNGVQGTFVFNESLGAEANAANLEMFLQGLGAGAEALNNATVTAISPTEFTVEFDAIESLVQSDQLQPLITWVGTVTNAATDSGFLPAVTVERVREPILIHDIPVVPGSPILTAANIEYAVKMYTSEEVSVIPVSGSVQQFDVTFTGVSGKENHPEMVLDSAYDEYGNAITNLPADSVRTLKESSPEFRVNAEEYDNPATLWPDIYDQGNPYAGLDLHNYGVDGPAVAMDADGDFVITWTSEVPDTTSNGSVTDIYARRFSPAGYQDNPEYVVYGEPIQGVRALGGEFRVNTTTNNPQGTPSVAMDDAGNFTVAWATQGQDFSYFNGVYMQRYNMDGERVGSEVLTADTNIHYDPYVSMSRDGHVAMTWTVATTAGTGTSYVVVRDPLGEVIMGPTNVADGVIAWQTTSCFDNDNNLAITWTETAADEVDVDQGGNTSLGIRGIEYQLYDDAGNVAPSVILGPSRINSAESGDTPYWFLEQTGSQALLDADGDIFVTFEGYGRDDSESDVDDTINTTLFALQNTLQAQGYDKDQVDTALAIRRAQLEATYSSNRGQANDILFFRMDASPSESQTILDTDSPVNADHDGHNTTYYFSFDSTTSGGNVTVRVYDPVNSGTYEDVTFDFVTEEDVPDLEATRQGIEDALQGIGFLGVAWPEPERQGPVVVELVSSAEIAARQPTSATDDAYWQIKDSSGNLVDTNDYCYRITFIGAVHDINVSMSVIKNDLTAEPIDEVQTISFSKDTTGWFGLKIYDPSTGAYVNPAADGSGYVYFDPTTPDDVATAIQNLLENFVGSDGESPYQGVTVAALTGGPPYRFQITYTGESGGTNQLQPQPVTPAGDTTHPPYTGVISVTTDVQGRADAAPFPIMAHFTYGDMGTVQTQSSSGITPEGSFTSVWAQNEQFTNSAVYSSYYYFNYGGDSNTNIYYRRYVESRDTAGPILTDFLLPDGSRLTSGGQVGENLQYIVVTFDEEMMTSSTASVTNTDNWALLKDGVAVLGGISSIDFGMNRAADLATALGLSAIGSNKWEAVITLDGNGVAAGVTPLGSGHYEIVAKSTLRDTAGNPLDFSGFSVNGDVNSRTFDVMAPTTGEELVNGSSTGSQVTVPTSQQTVASDADGDYVVVWTVPGQGVFAKLYDASYTESGTTRQSTTTAIKEFQVTSNTTASSPSVARDADGDFVITWSQQDPGDWNVWAKRFDAAGNVLTATGSTTGGAFRVNGTTDDIQRYSSVAMDAEGDFVITWQSLNQDGSGYGVYAQRYSPTGATVGGIDELQVINFVDQFSGTFRLQFNGLTTSSIRYSGNASDTAASVQSALAALGASVTVQATSNTTITIQFTGSDGSQDQPQITVASMTHDSGSSGQVQTFTRVDGVSAEFLVNDTTVGDQMHPSIGMSTNGSFVITWTSSGQDGDAAYETNVYAKRFFSNSVITGTSTDSNAFVQPITGSDDTRQFDYTPYIVTTDDPGNHVVPAGEGYDGVVSITTVMANGDAYGGSGSLLTTGMHILTAAHVVCAPNSNEVAPVSGITVTFDLPSGTVVYNVSQVIVNPNYTGFVELGGDLAVLVLESPAPTTVERYDIYRSYDELDRVFEMVGYGIAGNGETGATLPFGTKRSGENRFEATSDQLDSTVAPDGLVYDFDSGLAADDTLGLLLGIHDLGVGVNEACASHGDSGGPNFIDGKIAGVTSYGTSDTSPFGTIGVDVRVSLYADWIDQSLRSGAAEFLVNQTVTDDQMYSSVALDAEGNFVISWTSYGQDGVGNGPGAGVEGENGIYARRFDAEGNALSDEFLVNTFADGNQQYSHVAMDIDGDFAIVWESFQDRPLPPYTGANVDPDVPNSYGIYAQRYARTTLVGKNAFLGPNGEIGSEFAVNTTQPGDQRYPGIAMDYEGDFIIVWSGNGEVAGELDSQGVFQTWYAMPSDDAGPTVTDVDNVVSQSGGNVRVTVLPSVMFEDDVSQFIVTFSEDLNVENGTNGLHSVLNPANWQLLRDGQTVSGGIYSINYLGRNSATNKYEAIVTFDADSVTPGAQPLAEGSYVLTIRDRIEDVFENALDGNYDGIPGSNFSRSFSVRVGLTPVPPGGGSPDPTTSDTPISDTIEAKQDSPVVASNAEGDYVVIWVAYGVLEDDTTEGNIIGQRFNRFGTKLGSEFIVSSYTTGSQTMPDVAMDVFGDFIVVWAGEGIGSDNIVEQNGIFGRLFDASGVAQGDQFRVNTYKVGEQTAPAVAMSANGDFTVAWTGEGTSAAGGIDYSGVYGRSFNSLGKATTGDFAVSINTDGSQTRPDVAMDDDGNFTVVWNSNGASQDGSSWGVYARRYSSDSQALTGEFRVNNVATNAQITPQVAMDANGDFVVVWASLGQDGSGYGIYARRYNSAGTAQGVDALVNQTTRDWQTQPAVAMDDAGNYVVTWTTYGQDNSDRLGPDDSTPLDKGIYARIFNADGTANADYPNEFRVNATTEGDQVDSAVSMDSDGDFVIVWSGPDELYDTNVFERIVVLNPSDYVVTSTATSLADITTVVIYPTVLVLKGSDGNDILQFVAGPTVDTWVVTLNGVVQALDANVVGITFNALGGNDRVVFVGTTYDETATFYPTSVTFAGNGFTITASNIEIIRVDGAGGNDTVRMYDGSGDDTLTVKPGVATLVGTGVNYTALNFETVHAFASAGNDTANLYDTAGDDLLEMSSTFGRITGDGILYRSVGFDTVHAFASTGADRAVFIGTTGDELFQAKSGWARMWGDGYYRRAVGFATVDAYGKGGNDTAQLWGDADTADELRAWPTKATLTGTGYSRRLDGFSTLTVDGGTGGVDVAFLYDSAGDDTFTAKPLSGTLSGTGYSLTANQFEYTHAVSTGSGYDRAFLYDSAGDDTYEAYSNMARMYGSEYYLRAKNFDDMHGFASDGHDVANLYGSVRAEQVIAQTGQTRVYGSTFYQRAKFFEEVYLRMGDGNDSASVYDANVVSSDTAALAAALIDPSQIAWFYDIEKIQLRETLDSSLKTDLTDVDEVFAAWA